MLVYMVMIITEFVIAVSSKSYKNKCGESILYTVHLKVVGGGRSLVGCKGLGR